ncbi:hypothetical protein HPB47_026879, partial [Ixodes persulcatus]
GVLVHEVDEGQPCLTCKDKCPGFSPHLWRRSFTSPRPSLSARARTGVGRTVERRSQSPGVVLYPLPVIEELRTRRDRRELSTHRQFES